MIRLAGFFTTLATLLSLAVAQASPGEILQIKNSLSKEINTVVKQYDEDAYVVVNVIPKTSEANLPSTPFTLKDIVIRNSKGQLGISKVEVTVITHAQSLPENLAATIKEIVAPYSANPVLKLVTPPGTLWNAQKLLRQVFSPQNILSVLAMALFGLMFMLYIRSRKQSASHLSSAIESGVVRLSESIEQATTKVEAQQALEEGGPSVEVGPEDELSEARNEKVISGLGHESLAALFVDCYWCEKDNYASYLWNKASVEQREKVVQATDYLKKYCDLVADLVPVSYSYHQEPYYLSPLPLQHLNNEVVAAEVQKNPVLSSVIPRMRFESLELSTRERVEYSQLTDDQSKDWKKLFAKLPSSELRTLRRRTKLTIKSDQEETDILFLENITIEMKEDIVTIAWIKDLTVEEVDDILRTYTAQDLASVWVGPPEVLDYMKSAIPEKKYNLMSSYLEKTQPSRSSSLYRGLHKTIVQRIKQRQNFADKHEENDDDKPSIDEAS